ncbi:MAG: hypothetical protein K6A96_09300 [Prevotella sp.]|nr:hypothetical protein [Prevotella sp.]
MKYSVRYKRVYDKDNHIVEIDTLTIENRQAEYYSIGSRTPMIAALGEKKQHYFRARKGYELHPETELHDYVKNMLKHRFDTEESFCVKYYRQDYCIQSKECIFYNNDNNNCGCLMERLHEYDLKRYYDTATVEGGYNGFVADVLLTSSTHPQRKPLFLEVAVTHPCSLEKINSGHHIIEIFVRSEDDAFCELEETNKYDIDCKKQRILFHNFDKRNTRQGGCPHFAKEKKYAKQPYSTIVTAIPTKFYCIPQQIKSDPVLTYYNNTETGMLFASNYYAKPFVFDKAISLDRKRFVMMGKDIYGAIKPWVVYAVSWNGREFYHKAYGHFNYYSALKDFYVLQGREWAGGETLSDLCG